MRLCARTICTGTCGLVAMTSASHAEGRQFDPGQVYFKRVYKIATGERFTFVAG